MKNTKLIGSIAAIATAAAVIVTVLAPVDYPPFEAVDNESITANNMDWSDFVSGTTNTITIQGTADNWIIADGLKPDGTKIQVKCLQLLGKYILARNFIVTGCTGHAVFVKGQYIIAEKLEVFRNDKRPASGNWPSALKGEIGAMNIVFRDNLVYENYGEGMDCTMTINCWGYRNYLRDNWSMGIYADNSENVHFWGNHITNTGNPTYSRFIQSGKYTNGCGLIGAENYTSYGWTQNRIKDIYFRDNYFEHCKPISLWNPVGAALVNVNVQDNTFYDTFGGTVSISGITASGNVIVSAAPTATPGGASTMTALPTTTRTNTPQATNTATRTPTPTRTATPVLTQTAIFTPTPVICYPVYVGAELIGYFCP